MKCEKYWPSGTNHYQNISVTTTSEIELESWTIRDFAIKNVKQHFLHLISPFIPSVVYRSGFVFVVIFKSVIFYNNMMDISVGENSRNSLRTSVPLHSVAGSWSSTDH